MLASLYTANRTHTIDKFTEGIRWFVFGLAKKVLIADSVAPLVAAVYSHESPSFAEAWTGAIAYTVQLYFDFSGYSEMAVGLGLMIGIRFINNFDCPYISRSITESLAMCSLLGSPHAGDPGRRKACLLGARADENQSNMQPGPWQSLRLTVVFVFPALSAGFVCTESVATSVDITTRLLPSCGGSVP